MTGKEASAYLERVHGIRRTPGTLMVLRCRGGGPVFRKAGRAVIYDVAALDTWAEAIKSEPVASTSELRGSVGRRLTPPVEA
jgi:hypothetical protein